MDKIKDVTCRSFSKLDGGDCWRQHFHCLVQTKLIGDDNLDVDEPQKTVNCDIVRKIVWSKHKSNSIEFDLVYSEPKHVKPRSHSCHFIIP
jgi:hypothetical protein